MNEQAGAWLAVAEEDLRAAQRLLGPHDSIALFHAHQAAEKGLKALQIHRTGEYVRTHDLVRLFHELCVPDEFRSLLEELNPADTAARYPDVNDLEVDRPERLCSGVEELLQWIRKQSNT